MTYVFLRRELRRFFQQRMLEKSEGLAVKKQLQTSSVLELQRDAIVIVSLEEKKGDEEDKIVSLEE